jgi:hypothetical protein
MHITNKYTHSNSSYMKPMKVTISELIILHLNFNSLQVSLSTCCFGSSVTNSEANLHITEDVHFFAIKRHISENMSSYIYQYSKSSYFKQMIVNIQKLLFYI